MKDARREGRAQDHRKNSTCPHPRRAMTCPAACLERHVELVDHSGRVRATLCSDCDQATTRGQWLLALERAAVEAA